MKMKIPRNLASIASHCEEESSRYALGAIKIEKEENGCSHAVATDGRRMIHVQWIDDEDGGLAHRIYVKSVSARGTAPETTL